MQKKVTGNWRGAQLASGMNLCGAIPLAHIVGYNVGEPAAVCLFGPLDDSDGHICKFTAPTEI